MKSRMETRRGEETIGSILARMKVPFVVYDGDFEACFEVNKRNDNTVYITMLQDSKGGSFLKGVSYNMANKLIDDWDVELVTGD